MESDSLMLRCVIEVSVFALLIGVLVLVVKRWRGRGKRQLKEIER